ncbi:hypothetical protein DSO57_1018150 [Entomophthora muscae]|uniref:Uncharacterized protein n=1 Tax=Entomophthora muscae TaxID=34485 RepID=A0ACC2ST77_9FUNG|nr:hypothetical protein DSO57_1018150 [Entomophthora muscae]
MYFSKGLSPYLQGLMRHYPLILLLPEVIEVTRGLDLNHNPSPRQPGNNTPCPVQKSSLGSSSVMWPTSYVSSVASWATFPASAPVCIEVQAMLDTGAISNFIDPCLAQQLGLITSDTPTVVTMGNNTTDTARQCVAPTNIELGGVTTQV